MRYILTRYIVLMAVLVASCVLVIRQARAHSGSPSSVTWSNGQALTATDLNNTVAHMHNTLTGGIVDSNISSTAAISHTKLATPTLVPKAWGTLSVLCDGTVAVDTVCAGGTGSNVTSIVAAAAAGTYWVNLSYAPADANYAVLVSPAIGGGTYCSATARGATATHSFKIVCNDSAGALSNTGFSLMVMDN